jgi:hypothetical protein
MINCKFFLPVLLLAGLYPLQTYAADTPGTPLGGEIITEDKLTEESVRNFYDVSKKMHLRSYAEYASFMSAHTAEDAKVTLNMTNHLPGGQDQKQTLIMDKDQFMAGLPESYNASQGATIKHKIMDIRIAEDGKTGTVKDISFISNTMRVQAGGKWTEIEVQTQSTCDDNVVVTRGSMVQLHVSNCTAESYFFPKNSRPLQ